MSLNWKEINLILEELDLEGSQIQGVVQSAFDVIILRLHKKGVSAIKPADTHTISDIKTSLISGKSTNLLISLSSGACRLHETFKPFPKSDKPLRFAQFLNSRIVNGYIHKAVQLNDDRIVHFIVKRGEFIYNLYLRLWSNAANFIVTDENGVILDAMRRLPKRGEVTGGIYKEDLTQRRRRTFGSNAANKVNREYEIREFTPDSSFLTPHSSFNKKIDDYYAEQGGNLSLEALKDQVKRIYEGSIDRLTAALDRLREKAAGFEGAERLKTYGDLILSNIALINASVKPEDRFFETLDSDGKKLRIDLRLEQEPGVHLPPAKIAAIYYDQYRKAKNGLKDLYREIELGEKELNDVTEKLEHLLKEENPLVLAKLVSKYSANKSSKKTNMPLKSACPGLTFRRGDWQIIVGRNASENDTLLRRYAKGNDLWLHARDYHGSYVFIRQRSGKTVPLDILLDAGNLALYYSKGRNNAEGDLFYTQVKYLRRAKNGPKGKIPKGLVIPTQEKNLHIKLDKKRLQDLESCRQ